MTSAAPAPKLTPAEFIEWEKGQLDKHEFIDGEVYAMAGASPRHNKIVSNLHMVLGNLLRASPCDVLESNQKVNVPTQSAYVYPDVSIVCGEPEFDPIGQALLNPTVLVEVLSKSTEAFDRGDKFRLYRNCPSLRDYLLVSQRSVLVEHYQRHNSSWVLTEAGAGGKVMLADGRCFPVDEIYDDAVWRFPSDE
jgi:Uma2 family endonuclease